MVFKFGWQAVLNFHFLQQIYSGPTSSTKQRATQNRVLVFPKTTDTATWDRAQSGCRKPRTSVMLSSNPPSINTWADYKAIFYLGSNRWTAGFLSVKHLATSSPAVHEHLQHLRTISKSTSSLLYLLWWEPMAANPLSLFCQFWKALLIAVELPNLYKIGHAPRRKNQAPSIMIVQAPKTSFTWSGSSPLHSALLNLWVCTKIKFLSQKCQAK